MHASRFLLLKSLGRSGRHVGSRPTGGGRELLVYAYYPKMKTKVPVGMPSGTNSKDIIRRRQSNPGNSQERLHGATDTTRLKQLHATMRYSQREHKHIGLEPKTQAMPTLKLRARSLYHKSPAPGTHFLVGESVLSLCVCENRDGWLVAWGLCWCMLIRFFAVGLLPFTLLELC